MHRAYTKKSRNVHWRNIVNKVGYDVEILYENISWEEACEKEIQLIKNYGRMDLKLGSLVNMSDGGEGLHNPSQETRDKLKSALGREPWNKGKTGLYKLSDETKSILVEQRTGRKWYTDGQKSYFIHPENAKPNYKLGRK